MLPYRSSCRIPLILSIVSLGIVLRVIFVLFYLNIPIGQGGDDAGYIQLAQNIYEGHGFSYAGQPAVGRGPLYPAFMAFTAVFSGGVNPSVVRIFQLFLSIFTVAGVFYIGKKYFSETAGLFAAAFLSLNIEQCLLPTALYSECFYSFLIVLFLLAVLRWSEKQDKLSAGIAGAVFGLAVLCRSFLLLLPLLIVAIFIYRKGFSRQLVMQSFVFLLTALVMVGPWVVRNYAVFRKFIPVEAGVSGPVLWYASRGFVYAPEDEARDEPFKTIVRTLPRTEWDRILFKLSAENIIENPLLYVSSSVKRVWHLWMDSYLCYLGFYNPAIRDWVVRNWGYMESFGRIAFAILMVLAVYGIYAVEFNLSAVIILAVILYFNLYAAFTVFARFGSPAVPLISILAGAGLSGIVGRPGKRNYFSI